METGIKYHGSWDNACPSGISYTEHVMSLPLMMVQFYWGSGGKGIFAVHPVVASMLAVADPARFGGFRFGRDQKWPVELGTVGGIQIWADSAIAGDEILVVEDLESFHSHAKIKLSNFVSVPGVLDRMAQIT